MARSLAILHDAELLAILLLLASAELLLLAIIVHIGARPPRVVQMRR